MKTHKPLSILITDEAMFEWPEVVKLQEQGHTVVGPGVAVFQLVMGPNCWMMEESLRKYLPLAVKAARMRVAGKKGGVKNALDDTVTQPEGGGEGSAVVEGGSGEVDDGGGEAEGGC